MLLSLFNSASRQLEVALNTYNATEQKCSDIRYQLLSIKDLLLSYIDNPGETKALEDLNTARTDIYIKIDEVGRILTPMANQISLKTDISPILDRLKEQQKKEVTDVEKEITDAVIAYDTNKARQLFRDKYLPLVEAADKMTLDVIVISYSQKKKIIDSAPQNRTNATILAMSFIVMLIGAGLIFSYILSRSFAIPIIRLANHLSRAAKGDILDNYRYDQRADEIGTLSRSLNSFYEYIREMGVVASKIARGNLSVQIKPRSSVDSFGNAFNTMIENLQHSIADIRLTSDQLAVASTQIADASSDLSKLNISASASIEETTAAMHEMSVNIQNVVSSTLTQLTFVSDTSNRIEQMIKSIEQVATMAQQMYAITKKSQLEVTSGVAAMVKNIDGVSRVTESINRTSETIQGLVVRTEDIGKIVDVIAALADQTNLLALNAAIEAARAGEHGLGFAVVAEEVRKLAERSAKSTKDIEEIIKGIRDEAIKSADDMDKSTQTVSQVTIQGQEVTVALKRIEATVAEVCRYSQEIVNATKQQNMASVHIAQATIRLNESMQEINAAGQEQSIGAKQVVKAVELLREVINQNALNSSSLADNGQHLAKQSELLQDVVGRFQFNNGMRNLANDHDLANDNSLVKDRSITASLPDISNIKNIDGIM